MLVALGLRAPAEVPATRPFRSRAARPLVLSPSHRTVRRPPSAGAAQGPGVAPVEATWRTLIVCFGCSLRRVGCVSLSARWWCFVRRRGEARGLGRRMRRVKRSPAGRRRAHAEPAGVGLTPRAARTWAPAATRSTVAAPAHRLRRPSRSACGLGDATPSRRTYSAGACIGARSLLELIGPAAAGERKA